MYISYRGFKAILCYIYIDMFFHMNLTVLLYYIYALTFDGCKRDTSPYHFNTLLVFCFIFLY